MLLPLQRRTGPGSLRPSVPAAGQRGPHRAGAALILIGAIMSAIDQYFKVRASPSGAVCAELEESLPRPLHNLHKSG